MKSVLILVFEMLAISFVSCSVLIDVFNNQSRTHKKNRLRMCFIASRLGIWFNYRICILYLLVHAATLQSLHTRHFCSCLLACCHMVGIFTAWPSSVHSQENIIPALQETPVHGGNNSPGHFIHGVRSFLP